MSVGVGQTKAAPARLTPLLSDRAPAAPAAAPGAEPGPAPLAARAGNSLSLRTNFYWTFAGNVAYAACQWGMLVVLAKLGTTDHVGQFVLGLAVTAPVMLFSSLRLRSVQATDARGDFRFGDYFALRLLCTAAAVVTVAGIALAGGNSREAAGVILAVGLAKALESVSDIFHGLLQQRERMDWIARSLVLKGAAALAAVAVVFKMTHSVLYASLAMAAAFGVVLFAFDLPVAAMVVRGRNKSGAGGSLAASADEASPLRPRWHGATLRALLILSVPLGAAVAANSLSTNVPRYFLASGWGEGTLGILGALASPLAAGITIINALGQSAAPRLSKYYAAGDVAAFDATLKKLVRTGAIVGALGFVGAVLLGRQILLVLFRPEYAQHVDVFLWLVAAAAVQYTYIFLGSAINAMRRFGIQFLMHLGGLASFAAAAALIVPRYGLRGAAWAVFVGTVCEGLIYAGTFARLRTSGAVAVPRP